MVNFGRAEIVTVTLLCNKPACRKPPDTGVNHRVLSALLVWTSCISGAYVGNVHVLLLFHFAQEFVAFAGRIILTLVILKFCTEKMKPLNPIEHHPQVSINYSLIVDYDLKTSFPSAAANRKCLVLICKCLDCYCEQVWHADVSTYPQLSLKQLLLLWSLSLSFFFSQSPFQTTDVKYINRSFSIHSQCPRRC